jgi:hypothetical protein
MLSVFAAMKQISGMENESFAELGRNPVFQYLYLCRESFPFFVWIKNYPSNRRYRLFKRMPSFIEIDDAHKFSPRQKSTRSGGAVN